jgi:hypothetical protein
MKFYMFSKIILSLVFLATSQNSDFPHIIWMFYDQGYEQMGRFEKLCV